MLIPLLCGAVALALLALLLQDLRRLRATPALLPAQPPPDAPLVSILIPARNEAATIGRCLAGALAQACPRYEVIVVDDGSADATPQILAGLAAQHERLQVLRGRPLPPGWAGKCNACQQAADAARGEWLLFLDADTAPEPGLAAALVAHAERRGQDLLTIFPFLELGSFWERMVLPPFLALITAVFPPERQNAPDVRPAEVAANGQCILVRRAAYASIGGHGAVRGEVLEDMRLAQALRAAGYRTGTADGKAFLRVRMYTSGREVLAGLTKNAVAGFRAGGGRSLWGGARVFLLALAPFNLLAVGAALLALGRAEAWAPLLAGGIVALAALLFWALLLRTLYQQPAWRALLWPLGTLCYGAIAARAAWLVWSGRGVEWKGRTYER
jgi:hypothetical protein